MIFEILYEVLLAKLVQNIHDDFSILITNEVHIDY